MAGRRAANSHLPAHDEQTCIRAASNAGVHRCVLDYSEPENVPRAIRAALAGRQYLCPIVAAKVVLGS